MKSTRKWQVLGGSALVATAVGRGLCELSYPGIGWGVTVLAGVILGLSSALHAMEIREEAQAGRLTTLRVPWGNGQVMRIRTHLPAADFQKWVQCRKCGAGVLTTSKAPEACSMCGSCNIAVSGYYEASAGGGQ